MSEPCPECGAASLERDGGLLAGCGRRKAAPNWGGQWEAGLVFGCTARQLAVMTARWQDAADWARGWKEKAEKAEAEVARLREALLDEKQDHFFDMAGLVPSGGWWDTMALRSVKRLGDELVEAGRFERDPDGCGRRWFYRPLPKAAALDAKGRR